MVALSTIRKSSQWPDWVTFFSRFLILMGLFLAIVFVQKRDLNQPDLNQDLFLALEIGVFANIALFVAMFIPPLAKIKPFIIILGDWLIAGLFTYIASQNLILLTIIGVTISSVAMFRLGISFGLGDVIGVIVAMGIGIYEASSRDFRFPRDFEIYIPVLISIVIVVIAIIPWISIFYVYHAQERSTIRKQVEQLEARLQAMAERASTIYSLSARLNSSLSVENVLDAALDMAFTSIKAGENNARIVALALIYVTDNKLRIASYRALDFRDKDKEFVANQGIIQQALSEGIPIILEDEKDIQLKSLISFKQVQSLLCIPMTAGLNTYGVLLFGSHNTGVFDSHQIDVMKAIGIQATNAVHNADLYENLRREKERLIEIEESARHALVRDLHDVPTQTISGVVMRINALMYTQREQFTDEQVEELKTVKELAQRATEEIRTVLFSLRPLSLEHQGIKTALNQLADRQLQTYAQKVLIKVEPDAEKSLNPKQQGSVFYLVEEAVNNARKYAEASLIQVELIRDKNTVVVKVRDNGVGFDTNSVGNGYSQGSSFGMVNMQERAELIDGNFSIQSKAGKGTLITVSIPVTGSNSNSEGSSPGIYSRLA
ncbi:hypothetical protein MASR2M15_13660 [Anaerolineales bacterium]